VHNVDGINAGLAEALYEEYLAGADRVPEAWREFFANGGRRTETVQSDGLVAAYRTHGHLAARLSPLGPESAERLFPGLTPEPRLREVYCGTTGYEIEHLSSHAERVWLRDAIESARYRQPLPREGKRRLLECLSRVEGLERYLRRTFVGQKQFSIEGLDVLVPMLDAAIELAAETGVGGVVIGMAHRGRLNVLTHVCGRPYEWLLGKFEAERSTDALADPGDVKYHLGANATRPTPWGEIAVALLPNPSHLEAVDPVVEGYARAEQTDRSSGAGLHEPGAVLPVLVHGDAAFAGQGVVAETFNLRNLEGYATGGTLHLIANNQIGFTTSPADGRSTRYPSDLAKGFDVPIVHVNADDPEAALSAVRLAHAYREEFGHDIVVDLVGYRRLGHNEQDEPSYTQPLTVARIASHPTVRELYARRLHDERVVTDLEADALVESVTAELRSAHGRSSTSLKPPFGAGEPERTADPVTAVPAGRLSSLAAELVRVPLGFALNPKLAAQLERRLEALDEGGIDWGQAEALAFASLLVEGIPIRLAGQDAERGTFSHRHLVLHDVATGERHTPVQKLRDAAAAFEVHNSPLSEYGALGFEYGYSIAAPDALVLWEAQFGDFVNGAQIVVDQFIASGRSKWGRTSRLTLLLPHGYEGNGPEHSSARLERFLQSAAEENIRIANPSTAAQYFHLLRRQALDAEARPLIVMMPKGLLRLPGAAARLAELADGAFAPVLDDRTADPEHVRRLVLCSGKLFHDIANHEQRAAVDTVAIARIEQLYPFPERALADVISRYPRLEELGWTQEEPMNMGAFGSIRHRLEEALPDGVPLRYVGRRRRASPSEGSAGAHRLEQERIVHESLGASLAHELQLGAAAARRSARAPRRSSPTRCWMARQEGCSGDDRDDVEREDAA
jgi:2-oxoglutarate dehydrogenase E1 component